MKVKNKIFDFVSPAIKQGIGGDQKLIKFLITTKTAADSCGVTIYY